MGKQSGDEVSKRASLRTAPARGCGLPLTSPARTRRDRVGRGSTSIRRERTRGVTLLEMLVAVAIAAALVSLAAPSFASFRRAAGVSAATNELLGALHFARSAAILGGEPVTLCLSADAATCISSDAPAAIGWLVFAKPDAKALASSTDGLPILRRFRLPPDVSVHASRAAVTFWPVTRAGSTSTFDVCDVNRAVKGRAVIVSQTGRPRVAVEQATCAQ
jgi:type IV fimbrial biogenesis protein FimT